MSTDQQADAATNLVIGVKDNWSLLQKLVSVSIAIEEIVMQNDPVEQKRAALESLLQQLIDDAQTINKHWAEQRE